MTEQQVVCMLEASEPCNVADAAESAIIYLAGLDGHRCI